MSETEGNQVVQPRVIIKKLKDETLKEVYMKDHPDDADNESLTRTKMIEEVNSAIEKAGVGILLDFLKREELVNLAKDVNLQFKEDDNKNSKAVLQKKFKDRINEAGGIEDFLSDNADVKFLNTLCEALDEEPVSTSKDQLVKQVTQQVRALGAEGFWNSFDVNTLHKITTDLKLNQAKNTQSKRKLVESILTNSNPEKNEPKKKKRKITYSKKKKPIEKGITYDDIFQHYYQSEVKEYCKANGLRTSGKKKELILRILDYLNEDEQDSRKGGSSSSSSKKNKSED